LVPSLTGREADLLAKCVAENWVSSAGPEVSAFEEGVARLAGRKYGVAMVNGTAALHLALVVLGIGSGERVIVPDWTFAASVNAIFHAGGVAHFVDVRETDWALDPDLVEQELEKTSDIKAVVAVDPLGHAADLDRLSSICASHGVCLIEDAAGAIGAKHHGRPCGGFGDISTFSFNGNKTITTGGGGMLMTNDREIAERARHLSTQARVGRDYIHDEIGFNYRMPNLNAALGLAQLEGLEDIVGAKRAIASRYDKALLKRNDIKPMPRPLHRESSCWLYCVAVAHEAEARSLILAMDEGGIDVRTFWRSLSAQPPWGNATHTKTPISESLSGSVVSLPSSAGLSLADQDRVIDVLARWCGSDLTCA